MPNGFLNRPLACTLEHQIYRKRFHYHEGLDNAIPADGVDLSGGKMSISRERADWKRIAFSLAAFLSWLLLIVICAKAYAQVVGGTLSGTITNESGAVIPNAAISIANVDTGVVRSVKTDANGFYTAPGLFPANYEVTASAPGFTSQLLTGIVVTVGAKTVANFVMRPGAPQSVQRSTSTTGVEQTTSAVKGNVNSATVQNSPLNGRDWNTTGES